MQSREMLLSLLSVITRSEINQNEKKKIIENKLQRAIEIRNTNMNKNETEKSSQRNREKMNILLINMREEYQGQLERNHPRKAREIYKTTRDYFLFQLIIIYLRVSTLISYSQRTFETS